MKRLVLGDLHGHIDKYHLAYDHVQPDEVVCLGDYLDSFDVSLKKQEEAAKEVVEMKMRHKNPESFKILLGNHDFHYLYGWPSIERYSGFSQKTLSWACKWLNGLVRSKAISLAYIDYKNKIIYSHAGVSMTWLNDWSMEIYDINSKLDTSRAMCELKFTYGDDGGDSYGTSKHSSCIWIRPKALVGDMYRDQDGVVWEQVVGHTETQRVESHCSGKLWLCDSVQHNQFLVQTLDDTGLLLSEDVIEL